MYQSLKINGNDMSIRIGDMAPDFVAETTEGAIKFHEWLVNGWGILFSHPVDLTSGCAAELGEIAKIKTEFEKRNVKVMSVNAAPMLPPEKWTEHTSEMQKTIVNYPLIADPEFKVARLYGMINPDLPDKFNARSVFVIGPDKKVKLIIAYPASSGRNFDEILRLVDSLQLIACHQLCKT